MASDLLRTALNWNVDSDPYRGQALFNLLLTAAGFNSNFVDNLALAMELLPGADPNRIVRAAVDARDGKGELEDAVWKAAGVATTPDP